MTTRCSTIAAFLLLLLAIRVSAQTNAPSDSSEIDARAGSAATTNTSRTAALVPFETRKDPPVFQETAFDEVFATNANARWPVPNLLEDVAWEVRRRKPKRVAPDPLRSVPHATPIAASHDQSSIHRPAVSLASLTAPEPPLQLGSVVEGERLPPTPDQYQWFIEESVTTDLTDTGRPPVEIIEPGEIAIDSPPDDGVTLEFPIPERTLFATRLGYWAVDSKGSPVKTGEYQSLDSSPFLDLDGLHSDGWTTWDYYASLLDDDAPQAGLQFYGPTLKARIDYQGFLRRLDRDPYSAYVPFDQQPAAPLPGPPQNYRNMKEDLTVGDDFAIRVQQLDTSFAGKLNDHVNWRLNVWAMRKHGERQAAAFAHCFTASNATDVNGNPVGGNACHILIQSQRIDWLTAEIEPVLEGHYGPVTVQYSRTMRTLTADDQLVTRPYDNLGFNGELAYNLVPENYTEIDRLKIGFHLPGQRNGYARLYSGRTRNQFRETDRDFRGFDLRMTDRSFAGITLTGFVKNYVQEGETPASLLAFEDPDDLRPPIGYNRTSAGFRTTWHPFRGENSLRSRLRFGSGYEYRELDRDNAVFVEEAVTADNSFTKRNEFHVRTSMNWTPMLESYARYRVSFIDNPLYAAPVGNTTVNTSLPTQVHSLRLGNTWSPANNLFFHGMFGLNHGWNDSDIADFEEDQYDMVFTAWYAPTDRWSVSGGLGFYSNWIDQDITLGSKFNPSTLLWDYGGRSDVVNFGTTFAWTKQLTLSTTLDFVRGRNAFDPLTPWPDLWTYSDVNVETTRFGFGLDYDVNARSSLYFRYQLFDYEDKSNMLVSGTTDLYLFGGAAYY